MRKRSFIPARPVILAIAALSSVVPAVRAQEAAFPVPAATNFPPLIAPADTPKTPLFAVPLRPATRLSLLSLGNKPCYAMRTYGFPSGDMQASQPHPSSATTCAPSTHALLKQTLQAPGR